MSQSDLGPFLEDCYLRNFYGCFLPFLEDENALEFVADVEGPSTFLGAREATTAWTDKVGAGGLGVPKGTAGFEHRVTLSPPPQPEVCGGDSSEIFQVRRPFPQLPPGG